MWITGLALIQDIISQRSIDALEHGLILHLPALSFQLLPEEQEFLSPSYAEPKAKNISYNRHTQLLRSAACSAEKHDRFKSNAASIFRKGRTTDL